MSKDFEFKDKRAAECAAALFKAACILQWCPELEQECNALKVKLIEHFEDVPEKDECKKLGGMTYHSNGLCSSGLNSWTPQKLILPEWTSTVEEPEEPETPVASELIPIISIRSLSPIWHSQVATFMKRQVRISENNRANINDLITFIDRARKCTPEEKAVLAQKRRQIMYIKHSPDDDEEVELYINDRCKTMYDRILHIFYTKSKQEKPIILGEEEIKELIDVCKMYPTDSYNRNKQLRIIEASIANATDAQILDVQLSWGDYHNFGNRSSDKRETAESKIRKVKAELDKITDKNTIKALHAYRLV